MRNFKRMISIALIVLLSLLFTLPQSVIVSASAVNSTVGNQISLQTIKQAIDKASQNVINGGVDSEWEAIGLAKAGKKVPESYTNDLSLHIEDQVVGGLENKRIKITDIERLAMAATAIGKDPRAIDGLNLIEHIYNSPERRGGFDTMTFQGNNGPIFALIALDTKYFDVPEDAKWTRQKLIDELLRTQNDDGSWNLNENFDTPSIDITAMAIIGLSPYKDRAAVKKALDGAVNYLSSVQTKEGGFDGGSFVGGITSEAASQVIIGLTAYGIDPTGKKFTKQQNLIEHLFGFQNKDGGFKHTADYADSNEMATEQALQALVAYKLFLEGGGSLYQFGKINNTPEPPVDTVAPQIVINGISDGKTVSTSNITFTVKAHDDADGEVELAVKVNDKSLTPKDGTYRAVLKEGENNITVSATDQAGNKANLSYTVFYQIEKNIEIGKESAVKSGERIKINGTNTTVLLPDDIPVGTTLIVTKANEKHEGLKQSGDLLHFDFQYPSDKKIKGSFLLTMGVNDGIDVEKTGIYYFNEQTGKWKYTGGWGKAKNGVISIKVDHFSTYGVFTDTDGPVNIQFTEEEITSNKITVGLSADDPSGIKKYILYRNGKVIADVKGKETEFTDKDLKSGQDYEYRVIAVDGLGNKSSEESTTVTTLTEEAMKSGNDEDSSGGDKDHLNHDQKQTVNGKTATTDKGDKLPQTATNIYNFLIAGAALIIIGFVILYIRKRRWV
ncbi:fibronectin type III domain-containing protein [Virgibacillus dakarensis]|uniref:fibronectin type III domain-containing protein n=1 Tax=Virgibacillus dakarensis TaxID=1917889 RepID=UPI000B440C0A|nr:LPXTG cell wall anchor domain-containing protein [Virgibacillus dakarensis]